MKKRRIEITKPGEDFAYQIRYNRQFDGIKNYYFDSVDIKDLQYLLNEILKEDKYNK